MKRFFAAILLVLQIGICADLVQAQTVEKLKLKRFYRNDHLDVQIEAIGKDCNLRFIYDYDHLHRYKIQIDPETSKLKTVGAVLDMLEYSWDMWVELGEDGGTPDQNLILYDGFTIYYVDYLHGFYSAFNSNAIKDGQLYKGGFEAKYGGRLSSVTEITAKDGNKNKFTIGGEVGLLSMNALVMGTIVVMNLFQFQVMNKNSNSCMTMCL